MYRSEFSLLAQLRSPSGGSWLLSQLHTIRRVLSLSHYKLLALTVAVAYSIFYIVFTGILTYVDTDLSTVLPVPNLQVYLNGPIGTVPWIVWVPTNNLVFSMNFSAALFTTSTSVLVGINAALLLYSTRIPRCNCSPHASIGILGMGQGLLANFSCCGGGMLMAVAGASFPFFLKYASIFILSTLLILALTTVMVTGRIRQSQSASSATSP